MNVNFLQTSENDICLIRMWIENTLAVNITNYIRFINRDIRKNVHPHTQVYMCIYMFLLFELREFVRKNMYFFSWYPIQFSFVAFCTIQMPRCPMLQSEAWDICLGICDNHYTSCKSLYETINLGYHWFRFWIICVILIYSRHISNQVLLIYATGVDCWKSI